MGRTGAPGPGAAPVSRCHYGVSALDARGGGHEQRDGSVRRCGLAPWYGVRGGCGVRWRAALGRGVPNCEPGDRRSGRGAGRGRRGRGGPGPRGGAARSRAAGCGAGGAGPPRGVGGCGAGGRGAGSRGACGRGACGRGAGRGGAARAGRGRGAAGCGRRLCRAGTATLRTVAGLSRVRGGVTVRRRLTLRGVVMPRRLVAVRGGALVRGGVTVRRRLTLRGVVMPRRLVAVRGGALVRGLVAVRGGALVRGLVAVRGRVAVRRGAVRLRIDRLGAAPSSGCPIVASGGIRRKFLPRR